MACLKRKMIQLDTVADRNVSPRMLVLFLSWTDFQEVTARMTGIVDSRFNSQEAQPPLFVLNETYKDPE